MMDFPSTVLGDKVAAVSAVSLLGLPQSLSTSRADGARSPLFHESLFEVAFVVGIVGIGLSPDFDVALDGQGRCPKELDKLLL